MLVAFARWKWFERIWYLDNREAQQRALEQIRESSWRIFPVQPVARRILRAMDLVVLLLRSFDLQSDTGA